MLHIVTLWNAEIRAIGHVHGQYYVKICKFLRKMLLKHGRN